MVSHRETLSSLDGLPDEILLEVIDWLVLANKKAKYPPIAKKFNVLYVLSLVCRRLRTLLIPILRQDLHFAGHRSFDIAIRKFTDGTYSYGHLIKSIRVAQPVHSWEIDTAWGDIYPTFALRARHVAFPNLVSFECFDGYFSPREMEVLTAASTQNLKSISLVWNGNCGFVPQAQVPKLETLRLWIQIQRDNDTQLLNDLESVITMPYTSLTRLMLYNESDNGSHFIFHHLHSVQFPNLRALNVQEPFEDEVDWIFDFIQRHSTLLEVNLDLERASICFESIVKLVHGTGTWMLPSNAPPGTRIDQVSRSDTSQAPDAFDMHGYEVYTHKFAFCRRPLSSEAMEWRSAFGSNHRRYALTALAIDMEDGESHEGYFVSDLPLFVNLLAHFPELEQLRVSSCSGQKTDDFHTLMNDLIRALKRFPGLRKLAFHWLAEASEWDDADIVVPQRPLIAFIDDVCPPCRLQNKSIKEYDSQDIYEVFMGEGIEDNIRSVLERAGYTVKDLDEEEDDIAVRAWRELHEWDVRVHMEALAKGCPLLEEIEWYPRWQPNDDCVRWQWQVVRNKDGTLATLREELAWPGCLGGDPQPMLMLVGEELEYAKRSSQGRWHLNRMNWQLIEDE
ncbi:hypothetical protein EIP86_004493 [Pleurotus ostreatoroseus]|nr:hypothetical protein EIP86_004493 [Pleurotus ostreatoroseus]